MKTRMTFVSNSSSSSFAILKKYLSEEQIGQIADHAILGEEMGMHWSKSDEWTIRSTPDAIIGETWMDNFDMETFLEKIGVPMDKVEWSESPCGLMMDDMQDMLKEEPPLWEIEDIERYIKGFCEEEKSQIDFDPFINWLKKKNKESLE